jgi:cytochrome c
LSYHSGQYFPPPLIKDKEMRRVALIIASLTVSTLSTEVLANDAAALAKKYGCLNCHSIEAAVVGPAYKDVAAKYKGRADAPAKLVAKVQNGGAGSWGTMPMPPQKGKVSEADIKILVNWVLSQ